jgi:hypothetical protein
MKALLKMEFGEGCGALGVLCGVYICVWCPFTC